MSLSRRECLALAAGASAAAGCARVSSLISSEPAPQPPPPGDVKPEARLLNRLTFGPRPGDVARVRTMGHEAFVEAQLEAEEPEDPRLELMLARSDTLHLDSMELRELPEQEVVRQLEAVALLRAAYGTNQLLERMVEFWSDHFNVYARKGWAAYRKQTDDTTVIRPHALGSFRDLLRASAHSPAMLAYLDNQQNRKGIPNENYARELMELHTLGVHGGYTQQDVREVARCFSGWAIENRFLHHRGTFRFVPEMHDDGPKLVLGHRIAPGGGERDGEAVLGILASHPASAKFVSHKLCAYFLGSAGAQCEPAVARAFLQTRGDVRAMLRPILSSKALLAGPPILKRPFDLVVSSLRALGAQTDGGPGIQRHLEAMGQPLYQWPMPDGYTRATASWTGALLARWNFALALCRGGIAGTSVQPPASGAFEAVFSRRPTPRDKPLVSTLEGVAPSEAAALCLCAPEFQWR